MYAINTFLPANLKINLAIAAAIKVTKYRPIFATIHPYTIRAMTAINAKYKTNGENSKAMSTATIPTPINTHC